MADARTRSFDIPGLEGPSVRTQPTTNPVPAIISQRSGLEGLGAAIDGFFGKTEQGLAAVGSAMDYSQKSEMNREYIRQKAEDAQVGKTMTAQGQADALAGKPADEALTDDQRYAQQYAKTSGSLQGFQLGYDWLNQVYSKAKPGDNLAQQTNDWLKKEWGEGTGDPFHDAAALTQFKSFSDRHMLEFQGNNVKALVANGIQNQDSLVAQQAREGKLDPGSIASTMDGYRALDPMNADKVPLRYAHALVAGTDGSPAYAQNVLASLSKPGTGVNGKSYAESYPAAYQQAQEGLMRQYHNGNTLEGMQAWQGVHDRLRDAKDAGDYFGVMQDAKRTFERYGGLGEYNKFSDASRSALEKFQEADVAINSIGQMAAGKMPTDGKVVNGFFNAYLGKQGIDPYKDPEKAGYLVAQLGTIPPDLKTNMSRMLGDLANPEGQKAAFRFYQAIEGRSNGDPTIAKHMMSEPQKAIYDYASELARFSPDNPDQIFAKINSNLEAVRKGGEVHWAQITGQKEADAETSLRARSLTHLIHRHGRDSAAGIA